MEYREEEFLMLSGIQHFTFCRKQWALIHIEGLWEENLYTIEGRSLHDVTTVSFTKAEKTLLYHEECPSFHEH